MTSDSVYLQASSIAASCGFDLGDHELRHGAFPGIDNEEYGYDEVFDVLASLTSAFMKHAVADYADLEDFWDAVARAREDGTIGVFSYDASFALLRAIIEDYECDQQDIVTYGLYGDRRDRIVENALNKLGLRSTPDSWTDHLKATLNGTV
jgi:hypothetical protein